MRRKHGYVFAIALALSPVLASDRSIADFYRDLRVVLDTAPQALPVPVDGVRSLDLRDTYGAARSGGRRHEGIDIFARKGTPIRSTVPGLVWRVGLNRLGGNVVWVLGPGGRWHYYAHLDEAAKISRGQFVRAGELLGYVGDTGNARGTPHHLHYGIYRFNGEALNPYPLLVRAAGRADRHI